MGQRSQVETVARVLMAFLQDHTWKQSDLAREVGVTPRALRQTLLAIQEGDPRLERSDEPPHVYWAVPSDWFPNAKLLTAERAEGLARLIARLPRSQKREDALTALLGPLSAAAPRSDEPDSVAAELLERLEDSVGRTAVLIHYYGHTRGDVSDRHVSIHRFRYTTETRFVATCHRSNTLKWFRADGVQRVTLDPNTPFRPVDTAVLQGFLRESVHGFHGGQSAEHAFFVREPEARWVRRNLPATMDVEPLEGGVRFTCRSAATEQIARFVVGLGEAARAESAELHARVIAIADASLRAHRPSVRRAQARTDVQYAPMSRPVRAAGARRVRGEET